jgi:hypothetical protein
MTTLRIEGETGIEFVTAAKLFLGAKRMGRRQQVKC